MKISIITINYNHAEGLRKTTESVVTQSSHDYEYIVIDGGSTDGSVDVIQENADKIDYWVSEPDGGIYPAMNKGIRVARGEYCIFMNSGDEFYSKDVIENVVKQGLGEDIVCGDICFGENNISPNPDKVTMRTFYKSTLYHQASFIKTQLLREHPYDETLRSAADWKFFMDELVSRNATYKHIPIVIAQFEGGGFSSTQRELSRKEVLEGLQQVLPKRVLIDYEDYVYGNTSYRKMFTAVEQIPKLKDLIYTINKWILKILNIWIKAEWIRNLK